ncbi:bifunctional DedA family/phosphatase PAP2 family protein [Marinobacter fonticola]|uniref:bifunctional DedA family/phosphatase PAP2 family protein n=1 Tax=Marinobacter fonticola TaxID=2603215 RepID=UPI0011E7F1AB|nr:bifunctional DedA family/phosphatase PAP2 family protein [Marinobacter fonticola]
MMEWIQAAIQWLGQHPGWLSAALFGIALVESLAIAGVIVPGVAMMFAAATLAGQIDMPLLEALLWAGLGAIAGDGLSFWMGRLFQGRLDVLWPFTRYPRLIASGERFFHRHGGKSVVIGRFVGPIRPVLPLIAGAFQMPARRFFTFNILSAVGWAPVYVLPGYLVGSAMALDIQLPSHFYPAMGLSLALLALIYLVFFRLHWGLGEDSAFYRHLQATVMRSERGRKLWQTLSSERPQGSEFPLPSITLMVACTALFALWALLSMETHLLDALDQNTSAFFATLRSPLLDPVAVGITLLGDPALLTLVSLSGILFFWARGMGAAAFHILAAGVTVTVVTTLMKAGFAVPRPEAVSIPPSSYAFPSGHTSGITVVIGLTASFVAQEWPPYRRWTIYAMAGVPILLIALSRLYLGVHWFSDVIGGLLLGLAVCGLTRVSYSRYDRHRLVGNALSNGTMLSVAVTAAGYVLLAYPYGMARYAIAG